MNALKYLAVILCSVAVITILAIPAAWSVGLMLAKLGGANWYEAGCMSGVAYSAVYGVKSKNLNDFDDQAVNKMCFENAEKLRKNGHL